MTCARTILIALCLVGCGGDAFQIGEPFAPPRDAAPFSGDSSEETSTIASTPSTATDASSERGPVPVDGGSDAPAVPSDGAFVHDAPNPCPPAGCLCESQDNGCSAALPYSCAAGSECCNWRAPGC